MFQFEWKFYIISHIKTVT